MKIAPLPSNEQERLAMLRKYDVLDTEPEAAFEAMVHLASYICQTPIAAISLIDENRQWFKAIAGLDAKETSRSVAFCAHTILQNETMIVSDATLDERFFDNPLVTSAPDIRFYAGVPLVASDGQHLGTLCVIDRVARELNQEQLDAINILAKNIMAHLDLRLSHKQTRQYVDDLQLATSIFDSASEAMIVTDANNFIVTVNPAFTTTTGYTLNEVVGRKPSLLSSGRQSKEFYQKMWETLNATGQWSGELWNKRKNGEEYAEHLSISTVFNEDGSKRLHVAIFSDITEKKQSDELIWNQANIDHLTQLPNRRLFLDRLKHAMVSSARSGQSGALLLLDLDHFKTLNDTLGHDVGDMLLQQVSCRLTECVRAGDTIARLGGDEFVVLLENLSEHPLEAATQAETIGEKILSSLNQPYQLGNHIHHSTPSIGVTLFNAHSQVIDELLKQADIAMYQAKKNGRNALNFFDPHMQDAINNQAYLESELRKALEMQQLQLYYQIQVGSTGHAIGAEVLIRWNHPTRGMISPFHFIPMAEETGLILPIGQWVLETACAQLQTWQKNTSTSDLKLAVNISAKQFHQANFVEQVNETIQRHEIDPTKLKLELTESMLVKDIDDIIEKMNSLSQLGVQFSLDDFGTGYSSLQYLKKLPLSQLKIDQSFVRDIFTDESDRAIVRTIIAMAHSLNFEVIAEGVETEDQRQCLLSEGCTNFQGYLFSKPVPIVEFEALFSKDDLH